MVKNGFASFCIFETNPFILKHFIQNIVIGSHLHSTDEVLIIRRKNSKLVTFDWGGGYNFYCTLHCAGYTRTVEQQQEQEQEQEQDQEQNQEKEPEQQQEQEQE